MNSAFEFHIGDLRSGRAEPRDIKGEAAVDWHLELSRVLPDPPLLFEFRLAPIAGGITVMGTVEATVTHRCHRCLDEWTEDVLHDITQMVTTAGDEDDDYRLEGESYDFEVLIRDELMLSLPLAPLCGPDCKGLVAEAGSGLNTELSEQEAAERSPFSVLKDLLDNGE